MGNIGEVEFEKLIRTYYQFLVDDFNFVIKKLGD